MRKFYILFLIFNLIINGIVFLFPDAFVSVNELYYVFCIIIYLCLIFLSSYRREGITTLLVFQAPFGLFILGRFIGNSLDSDLSLESIDFFYSTNLSHAEVIKYLSINMIFFILVFLGYMIPLVRVSNSHIKFELDRTVVKFFSRFVAIVTVIGMFITLKGLYTSVSQYGYAALYILKKENANDSSSIFITLLLVTIGIIAMQGCRSQLKTLMIVLFCYSFALLFMGARGPMMTYIILWLWLYKKNINIMKLGIATILILAGVQYISAMMRTTDTQYNILAKTLYDMGTTFIVLPLSAHITDWPGTALVQNLIPMTARIASFFTNINPYEANLANYLGYYLNPDLYWKGVGLGWSVVIDFSIYSQGNMIFIGLFAMIFGKFLKNLDCAIEVNSIRYGLATALILPLGFLYRSGLFSIIPLAIYFFIMIFSLSAISNIIRRVRFGN